MTAWGRSDRRVLLDCRYLHLGGAGRATELLLRGLQRIAPPGRWLLWGAESVRPQLWDGAEHVGCSRQPTSWWGQRELFAVPPHDAAVYMHQIRPLRLEPSVTLMHDTIPLRHGGSRPARAAKRTFLRASSAASSLVLTVSDYSRSCLLRDLGMARERLRVVRYPVDDAMAARVDALRSARAPRDRLLYVGRFAPHKDLQRLLDAFSRTSFRASGGELLVAGGSRTDCERMERLVTVRGLDNVRVEGHLPQPDLEELYATSAALVMPSLEEGFGLPVWEALCCGLPVCASDGGALRELVAGRGVVFRAGSADDMARAVDAAVASDPAEPPVEPSVEEFAASFVDALAALPAR
jgi:glycosyltransferase involved in cell wall biosynthesis